MQDGKYFAKVLSAVTTKAQTGNPQMAVKLSVTHSANGDSWDAIEPVEKTMFWSLTDAAWEFTRQKLEMLGFDGDFANPGFAAEALDTGIAVGLHHEEYQGKSRERWELADYGGSREYEQAPEDILRKLGATWKATKRKGGTPF